MGPLDALSGLTLGFSTREIGLLGSAHFVGFFIGCWWAPRLIGDVGHSRAFAAFTALGAIGLLLHMMVLDAYAWALMRVATGVCVAGCYTVIEAWLQAKVTNETRGRTMGVYRIVDLGASLSSQLLIGILEPAAYVSYNLLAILTCASLLPLILTKSRPPEMKAAPRLRPLLAYQRSPLAVAAVIVAGLTASAFRMVGPIYGEAVGLRADQIGYFLAAFMAGGALAQYPVGWLADKYDRRWVLIGASLAGILASAGAVAASTGDTATILLASGAFGFATFPIFSIAAAHAHDFANEDERVELSAALIFFFAVGAIAAPLTASVLIETYGPPALFAMIAVGHGALAVIGLLRMRVRPTLEERTPYVYSPRTSLVVGRLMKRLRAPEDVSKDDKSS